MQTAICLQLLTSSSLSAYLLIHQAVTIMHSLILFLHCC